VKEMKFLLIAEVLLFALMTGCCVDHHKEPSYPNKASLGWKEFARGGSLQTHGVFVLKKGESTDNGKIQVKVIDITPNESCDPQSRTYLARVELQLTRLSDQKILCSDSYEESSTGIFDCGNQIVEFGISGYRMNTINLKEGWVFFELWG
jgi:hypothetical protein